MTPAARRKIQLALKELESAQRALGNACEELSPIVGLSDDWERVGKLYDTVKAEWHRINALEGPFRLDSEDKSAP